MRVTLWGKVLMVLWSVIAMPFVAVGGAISSVWGLLVLVVRELKK